MYEVEINFVGENLRKYIKTLNTREEKLQVIFRFLELLNVEEKDFFYNLYQSYDQVLKIDGQDIRFLNEKAQNDFIQSVEDNGFYIVKRPDAKIRYEVLKTLYDEWPWIKPYDAYIDLFGIKHKKIMRPVVIGSKYMYVLKQTSNKNFSARSTGRLDKKGLPAKSSDKKANLSSFNTNPIKIGEAHNLFAGITGLDLAEFNLFMRSSPIARKSLDRILEAENDPFEIKRLKVLDNYTNQNAIILEAYLKSMGLRLNFVTDDTDEEALKDTIQEMRVDGFTIIDRGYKKPIYKKLLDTYLYFMEKFTVVSIDEPNLKKKMGWDYVFDQDEIKSMDLMGITKEDMMNLVLNQEEIIHLNKVDTSKVEVTAQDDGDESMEEIDDMPE